MCSPTGMPSTEDCVVTLAKPANDAAAAEPTTMTVQLIGGPTAVFEIGGVRVLSDPTFDPHGDHVTGTRHLVKTEGPAVPVDGLGRIDVVVLSHDQHADNLDDEGRKVLQRVPLVLSTAAAAERLAGVVRALPIWQSHIVAGIDGGRLRVTGIPAQHGPQGTEHITGDVRGFVLSGEGLPTVYISGDNASLDVVREVADHAGPIDVAVLFAGRAAAR